MRETTRSTHLRRTPLLRALILALALCALAPVAASASPKQVIKDCVKDSRLNGDYSQAELRKALARLPTDIDEYTDCRDQIRAAMAGAASQSGRKKRSGGGSGSDNGGAGTGSSSGSRGSGDGSSSGGATRDLPASGAPSASEQEAIDQARRAAREGSADSGGGGIPTSLLVVLIIAGLGALGAGGMALRARGAARRPA